MTTGDENDDKDQPSYPGGVPNFNRFRFLPLGVISGRTVMNAEEGIRAVSEALNRPARYVDDSGYEHEITAGAIHPTNKWPAWVEYKCKKLETGYVEIEFRLKAQGDGPSLIDWVVETYNPFFGCRVGYMAWHEQRVVMVYREKRHDYACSLGLDGTKLSVQIADEWLATSQQILFRSDEPDYVERLAFPDLRRLDPVSATEARDAGVLPPEYDKWNEWHKKHLATKPKRGRGAKG